MIVNIPASWFDRQDVARRLLASARELGEDVRVVRWRHGGYNVPERVARHAGFLEDIEEPTERPKRRKAKASEEA